MIAAEVVLFVLGAAIVLLTLRSAVRTFLVPRALQAYLARTVFVFVRRSSGSARTIDTRTSSATA